MAGRGTDIQLGWKFEVIQNNLKIENENSFKR